MPTPRVRTDTFGGVSETSVLSKLEKRNSSTVYWYPLTYANYPSTVNLGTKTPKTYKSMNDWVTPNFHKLMKEGKIINNPLVIREETELNPFVSIADYSRVTNYTMYNTMVTPYAVVQAPYRINTISGTLRSSTLATEGGGFLTSSFQYPQLEDLVDRAVTQAWSNVNESDMLALASVAESQKTIRDLQLLARKIIKAVKFIKHPVIPKRMTLKHAKVFIKQAEELYMQARYNLRPLYYDILGVMKIASGVSDAKRARSNIRDRYTIRGTSSWSDYETDEKEFTSSVLPGVRFRCIRTNQCEAEVRAGVLCQARDMTRWEQSGIGLLPETVWELTPFSFILDWFANFGDVIASFAPKPGVDIRTSWATTTQVVTQTVRVQQIGVVDTPPQPIILGRLYNTETTCTLSGDITWTKVIKDVVRTPNPRRSFVPHLNVRMDAFKLIDLAVIGRNLSKSIRNYRV